MASVRPFQGVLYDPHRVDLSQVVAPPYDVISPADQRRYYEQDPHNVVRLIAGDVRPSDTPEDNKYTRAAGFFRQWLAEGVLQREMGACLYLYRHQFTDPINGEARSRLGILGVVELEPFGRGVLPHEQTHARAKADRLSLTRAVVANLSPVFALYEDPQSAVRPIVAPAMTAPPRLSIMSEDGDQHTVWSLSGARRFSELADVFNASPLYIADGHHRYETALNFRSNQRQAHPEAPPDAAFNYVLMLLVDVRDPGLIILPTHRVVHDFEGFDAGELLRRLGERHRVVPRANQASLLAAMQERTAGHRIGMVFPPTPSPSGGISPSPLAGEGRGGGSWFTVDVDPATGADPVSQLDVSILHREILERQLGLQQAELEQERYLSYSRDAGAVLRRVESGAAQAAFLLRPPAVSDVVQVARAGQVMPQKSTYFFPKPASGIVFNPLDGVLTPSPLAGEGPVGG
ncbi:MAG TPA: DUF1015 domain-containing protein [Candidatus Dormibacteraeota bacterium]|nr:DUF1015 domain-containing protein [Candidatus Dormibacteraeota bacterium]